jgi:chaperonin GroES
VGDEGVGEGAGDPGSLDVGEQAAVGGGDQGERLVEWDSAGAGRVARVVGDDEAAAVGDDIELDAAGGPGECTGQGVGVGDSRDLAGRRTVGDELHRRSIVDARPSGLTSGLTSGSAERSDRRFAGRSRAPGRGIGAVSLPGNGGVPRRVRHQLRPLFDRVVIKELEPDRFRRSGIVVPAGTHEPPPQHGIVLAVGPGIDWWASAGLEMPVRPGDHVVFPASAGTWVEVDEERLLVCGVAELLGVLLRDQTCPECSGSALAAGETCPACGRSGAAA